jgi:hypothetical protein
MGVIDRAIDDASHGGGADDFLQRRRPGHSCLHRQIAFGSAIQEIALDRHTRQILQSIMNWSLWIHASTEPSLLTRGTMRTSRLFTVFVLAGARAGACLTGSFLSAASSARKSSGGAMRRDCI